MNPVLQAIADRRSIRAYTNERISSDQLQVILDAGLAAPSARNTQPWHFTAVQDEALLARVNDAFCQEAKRQMPEETRFAGEGYSVFHHAPTVIFLSCPPLEDEMYAQTDVGIAIENMALAAHSLGLGSVILGMPRLAFAGHEADALREALHFPVGHHYCLSIAIGMPTAAKGAHPTAPDRVTIIR